MKDYLRTILRMSKVPLTDEISSKLYDAHKKSTSLCRTTKHKNLLKISVASVP